MSFWRDLFTGPNNSDFELGRALWGFGTLMLILYQGYAIYKGHPFEPDTFGFGLTGVLAGGGFGVAMKDYAKARYNAPMASE